MHTPIMHTFTNIHSFSQCPDTHTRAYHSLIHTVTCPHSYTLSQLCIDASTLIYNTTAPPMHSHPHAHMHVPDTFTPADSIQTPLPLPHTHRQVQIYFLHPYSDPRVHTAPEDYLNHHVCTYKPRRSDIKHTSCISILHLHTHIYAHIHALLHPHITCTYTSSPIHVAAPAFVLAPMLPISSSSPNLPCTHVHAQIYTPYPHRHTCREPSLVHLQTPTCRHT